MELTSSFWELILKKYMNAVPFVIERDDFCFEFLDDDTSGIVPHYHGNRLMKDEYIDGEISRDVCRTFPHHLLFRHKDNGCQGIIERLQLVRLWGYGFPDIPLYVYVLRKYIK